MKHQIQVKKRANKKKKSIVMLHRPLMLHTLYRKRLNRSSPFFRACTSYMYEVHACKKKG